MNRMGTMLAAALARAALVRPAPAQLAPPDTAALLGTTRQLMDAITHGDSAVWARQLSPRWFITDEEGRHVTRAELLGEPRGLPAGQRAKLEVKNPRFASAPGVVVLSYDIDEWHDHHGQELRTRFHATDTWVRERGTWRMLASQITALPTRWPAARRSDGCWTSTPVAIC